MMYVLLAALLNYPGALPVSEDGYRYVCTSVDFYTKFVDLFPLRDKAACGVSRCIQSFVHR